MLEVRATLNLVKQFEGRPSPMPEMCKAVGWPSDRLSRALLVLTRIYAVEMVPFDAGRHTLKLTDRGVRLLDALNAPGLRDVGSDDSRIAAAFAMLQGHRHDLPERQTGPGAQGLGQKAVVSGQKPTPGE